MTADILLKLRHPMALLGALLLAGILLAACSEQPVRHGSDVKNAASSAALKAGNTASSMLGKPYRYGGTSPSGFDCSGLVYYSYGRAGAKVPRTTEAQSKATQPVSSGKLQKGDLLFFNERGQRSSHVAIYLGDGTFVHAPSSGKRVRVDRLADPYWKKIFAGGRRFVRL
jgi:murein DD-endopeptidase